MILNVSSRTDIVAFYTEWFIKRYKEGYVDVRNPFNPKLVNRIYFDDVDLILFCTKNPIPILPYLESIDKPILFHITLTSYNKDIEPGVYNKKELIEAIKRISNIVGIDNLYIRYDPIFLSTKYTVEYHLKAFDKLCVLLDGYVKHFIVSFIDEYRNVKKNYSVIGYKKFLEEDYMRIGKWFSKSAKHYGMSVQTCFEDRNLLEYGFVKGECLSHTLAFKLTGKTYKNWQARRGKKCSCVQMVDIGVYNSCKHFCKYCYANYDENQVEKNFKNHNPNSSLLVGKLEKDDIIKVRKK